jgi:hypothetical protein
MTKLFKNCCNQSTLFLFGMIFFCTLSAENILQEQYRFPHKNEILTYEPTESPIGTSRIVSSKFVMGDKGFKHDNLLKDNSVPKNSQVIDHQIFASPKSIKPTKRIFI